MAYLIAFGLVIGSGLILSLAMIVTYASLEWLSKRGMEWVFPIVFGLICVILMTISFGHELSKAKKKCNDYFICEVNNETIKSKL